MRVGYRALGVLPSISLGRDCGVDHHSLLKRQGGSIVVRSLSGLSPLLPSFLPSFFPFLHALHQDSAN